MGSRMRSPLFLTGKRSWYASRETRWRSTAIETNLQIHGCPGCARKRTCHYGVRLLGRARGRSVPVNSHCSVLPSPAIHSAGMKYETLPVRVERHRTDQPWWRCAGSSTRHWPCTELTGRARRRGSCPHSLRRRLPMAPVRRQSTTSAGIGTHAQSGNHVRRAMEWEGRLQLDGTESLLSFSQTGARCKGKDGAINTYPLFCLYGYVNWR